MQKYFSSYIFPPIDKYAGSPSRAFLWDRTLKYLPNIAQPLCQPRNWNPGRIFLSNFKTKHSWPREKGLERRVQTDTRGGGVKKDTCGVEQTGVYYSLKFYSVQKCRFCCP